MAGVIRNDKAKAAKVRNLLLDEIIRLFETDPHALSERELDRKNELLLRMAPNTLPRLHEVAGEDGGAILIKQVVGMEISPDGNNEDTIQNEKPQTTASM